MIMQSFQDYREEAMNRLKETWDFKTKITSLPLTGTYAEERESCDKMHKFFLQAAPDYGPVFRLLLYSDACIRYGHAAAEVMYPMIDGERKHATTKNSNFVTNFFPNHQIFSGLPGDCFETWI